MQTVLKWWERNFFVCSDCCWFAPFEDIGDPYYGFKRGKCRKHNTIQDNRWETTCPDCSCQFRCRNCDFFEEIDHSDIQDWADDEPFTWCSRWGSSPDPDCDICDHFEKKKEATEQ